jgi:hypothetical protein
MDGRLGQPIPLPVSRGYEGDLVPAIGERCGAVFQDFEIIRLEIGNVVAFRVGNQGVHLKQVHRNPNDGSAAGIGFVPGVCGVRVAATTHVIAVTRLAARRIVNP